MSRNRRNRHATPLGESDPMPPSEPSVAPADCPHPEVVPTTDPNWGRCTACGDNTFPLMAFAAGEAEVDERSPAAALAPKPIRIRELRFRQGTPFTTGNVVARTKDGVTVEIQFEPWQRHHRVREIVDGQVGSEYCIPESWAMYVPLADEG
jgi:hypothetical protein